MTTMMRLSALLFLLNLAASQKSMVQTNNDGKGAEDVLGGLQKEVKGRIKINGAIFETQCDCAKDAITKKAQAIKEKHEMTAKCQRPQKYQIFYDRHEKVGVRFFAAARVISIESGGDSTGAGGFIGEWHSPRGRTCLDLNRA